jgi:phytanoyl-CoA hydroxylase
MPAIAPPVPTSFTAEELAAFEHDGFLVVRGLAEEALRQRMLAAIHDGIERQIEPIEYEADLQYPGAPAGRDAQGGRTPRRLLQAHGRGAVFTGWLVHPGVTGRLRGLLGSPLYCPLAHHNCVMTKSPRYSSETGWHQDIRYWSFAERNLVTVWLALGEEHPENGCLYVIPGTHRITFSADRFDTDLFFRADLPDNAVLIEQAVPVELSAGDVLFFHCRTLHAASANHTDQTKLSVVFTFRGEGNLPTPGSRSASLPEMLIHT